MLKYTDEQIRNILIDLLETEKFSSTPVGNHHLGRHLVYEISLETGEKYIFKLYYRDRRRSREIAALKALENSNVKCSKIVKYGNLKDGEEWLITKYMEGETLDSVMDQIPNDNKVKIFAQMGEELGKLHSFKTFEFFGEWDETGGSLHNIVDYYQYFVKKTEATIDEVLSKDLPNKEILIEAIKQIRSKYGLLNINTVPRLIHNDFDGRNILVKRIGDEYHLSGIIDFESSYPGNSEENFMGLYYRYFLDNDFYKETFLHSYNKYLDVSSDFNDRLNMYLLSFAAGNCSWSHVQAPDYYNDNIAFLRKIL